MFAHFDLMIII